MSAVTEFDRHSAEALMKCTGKLTRHIAAFLETTSAANGVKPVIDFVFGDPSPIIYEITKMPEDLDLSSFVLQHSKLPANDAVADYRSIYQAVDCQMQNCGTAPALITLTLRMVEFSCTNPDPANCDLLVRAMIRDQNVNNASPSFRGTTAIKTNLTGPIFRKYGASPSITRYISLVLSAACNTYSLTVDNDIRDEYGVTPALGLLAEISQRIHIFPQETFTVDPSQPPVQYRAVMRFCQDKADTLLNTCSPQLKHTAKDALKFSLSGILKMFFYYTKAKQDAGISLGADIPWHPNSKRGSIPCQLRSIFQITPSQLESLRQKVPATAIQIIGQSTQDCNDPNLKWHVRVTFPALTNGICTRCMTIRTTSTRTTFSSTWSTCPLWNVHPRTQPSH